MPTSSRRRRCPRTGRVKCPLTRPRNFLEGRAADAMQRYQRTIDITSLIVLLRKRAYRNTEEFMSYTVVNRDAVTGRNVGHDLTGFKTGLLTVQERTDRRCEYGYTIWKAVCECGNEIERASYRFVRGMKSCGCGPLGRPRIAEGGAHINSVYGHYRTSAKARNIEFNITKPDFAAIITMPCHYCGAVAAEKPTHRNLSGTFAWNGVGRMDNAAAYEPSNCVPCCTRCNWAKGTQSVAEFREWIGRAYEHQFKTRGNSPGGRAAA